MVNGVERCGVGERRSLFVSGRDCKLMPDWWREVLYARDKAPCFNTSR